MTIPQSQSPCAGCMGRRQFLSAAAGAAGLVALSACGDGDLSGVAGPVIQLPSGSLTIDLTEYPGLANVEQLVQVTGRAIAVKRTGASTFVALSLACTHQGCPVTITSNTQLDCPCHFSRFDGEGAVLRGPADRPLPRFNTTFDSAANTLTIE